MTKPPGVKIAVTISFFLSNNNPRALSLFFAARYDAGQLLSVV